jgi:hypothetical protein
MIRHYLIGAALLACAGPALGSTGPLTPEQQSRAIQLLQKLGHPSFKVREAASAELVQFGRAVEPVLRQGLASADPETRSRCKRLLPMALHYDLEKQIVAFLDAGNEQALPGWDRFKQAAGADDTAKALFVDLHRIDPEFMEALAKEPAGLKEKFQGRCLEFMNMRNFALNAAASVEQIAFLLFAALEPQVTKGTPSLSYLSGGLNSMSYQPHGKQVLVGNPAVRRMLIQYLRQSDGSASYNNLYLVSNLELREGVDIARDIIRLPNRDIHAKTMAIALLGKLGTKEHIGDIEPFLTDKTGIGSVRFGNGPMINTQARDVALAALVQLSGQAMSDYNFPYLKMFPVGANFQLHLSPGMLGFSDDASRDAAIKKWTDWRVEDRAKDKK